MEELRDKKLRKRIKDLMFANINEGYSEVLKKHFCYIRPSPGIYSFQWFWDSCFHVFILCRLGEYELAKRDIISLFAIQEENGFVGHVIFWRNNLTFTLLDIFQIKLNFKRLRPHMTAIIQPTFCAQAVERIFKDTNDLSFLKIMLPKLKKYHEWLEENRDFEKQGLISIITSYESGMDWKPSYDEVLNFKGKANYKLFIKLKLVDVKNFFYGYNLPSIYKAQNFIVKDAGFNTIYALDLKAMSNLCLISGEKEQANKYKANIRKLFLQLSRKCLIKIL